MFKTLESFRRHYGKPRRGISLTRLREVYGEAPRKPQPTLKDAAVRLGQNALVPRAVRERLLEAMLTRGVERCAVTEREFSQAGRHAWSIGVWNIAARLQESRDPVGQRAGRAMEKAMAGVPANAAEAYDNKGRLVEGLQLPPDPSGVGVKLPASPKELRRLARGY